MSNKSLFLFCNLLFAGLFSFLNSQNKIPFNKPNKKKPFNIKAVKAKEKGLPLIVQKKERLPSYKAAKALPLWPGFLRFPDHGEIAHAQVGFNWSKWAYDQNNNAVDASRILFGDDPVRLEDVSIISRMHRKSLDAWLAAKKPADITTVQNLSFILRTTEDSTTSDPETIEFNNGNPSGSGITLSEKFRAYNRSLAYLAQRVFDFKSRIFEPFLTLNYSKSFFDNKSSLGIQIPILVKIIDIDMISELSTTDNEVLSRDAQFAETTTDNHLQDFFFSKYPGGYQDFFKQILKQKDFSTDSRSTKFGIGDITVFVNHKVDSEYWTQSLFGLGISAPSAPEANRKNLWPANLGRGGFWQVSAHNSICWKSSKIFNPHIFTRFKFNFSSSVEKRISRLIDFDVDDSGANSVKAKDLPLGEFLKFSKDLNKEAESTIPALAEGPTQRVEFRKGAEINFRLGNVFDQAFIKRGYLDIFYDFKYKFSDSLSSRYQYPNFDTASLTKNSESWSHTISAGYGYCWDDKINLELKGSYVFAGHRALKTYNVSGAMQYKF